MKSVSKSLFLVAAAVLSMVSADNECITINNVRVTHTNTHRWTNGYTDGIWLKLSTKDAMNKSLTLTCGQGSGSKSNRYQFDTQMGEMYQLINSFPCNGDMIAEWGVHGIS